MSEEVCRVRRFSPSKVRELVIMLVVWPTVWVITSWVRLPFASNVKRPSRKERVRLTSSRLYNCPTESYERVVVTTSLAIGVPEARGFVTLSSNCDVPSWLQVLETTF